MQLDGNLNKFPLRELIEMVVYSSVTGVLELRAGTDIGQIFFRDGQPYHAKQVVFQAAPMGNGMGVRVSQVVESAAPMRMSYDPKNPAANADGYITMPNVNPVEEMVNMISASRAYQTNAEVMSTAKSLMLKTLAIGQ